MTECKKKALLDADFIIKSVNSDNKNVKLIDFFMSMESFEFVCHEKILEEVSRHEDKAKEWLLEKIDKGYIKKYSDNDIFAEISKIYFKGTKFKFLEFVKNSCRYISENYFYDNYKDIIDIDNLDDQSFLNNLKKCDDEIGKGNSIGERKSMILLQMLQDFYPNDTYYFCSDDKKARIGLVSITSFVQCISILTILNRYKNIDKEVITNYYNSYIRFINRIDKNQTNFKIFKRNSNEMIRVDFNTFFDDMINDKFVR